MSIWTLIEFAFVSFVGFHAALFLFLILRLTYGFPWAIAGYFATIALVCFILLRIGPL